MPKKPSVPQTSETEVLAAAATAPGERIELRILKVVGIPSPSGQPVVGKNPWMRVAYRGGPFLRQNLQRIENAGVNLRPQQNVCDVDFNFKGTPTLSSLLNKLFLELQRFPHIIAISPLRVKNPFSYNSCHWSRHLEFLSRVRLHLCFESALSHDRLWKLCDDI